MQDRTHSAPPTAQANLAKWYLQTKAVAPSTWKPAAPTERHDPQITGREPKISESADKRARQIVGTLLKRVHLINCDTPLFDPFDF